MLFKNFDKVICAAFLMVLTAGGSQVFAQSVPGVPSVKSEGTNSAIPADFPNIVRGIKTKLVRVREWNSKEREFPEVARERILTALNVVVDETHTGLTELIIRYVRNRAKEINDLIKGQELVEVNTLMAEFLRRSLDLAILFNEYDVEAANQKNANKQGKTFAEFSLVYSAFMVDQSLKYYRYPALAYLLAYRSLGYIFNDLDSQNDQIESPEKWEDLRQEIQYFKHIQELPDSVEGLSEAKLTALTAGVYQFYERKILPMVQSMPEPFQAILMQVAPAKVPCVHSEEKMIDLDSKTSVRALVCNVKSPNRIQVKNAADGSFQETAQSIIPAQLAEFLISGPQTVWLDFKSLRFEQKYYDTYDRIFYLKTKNKILDAFGSTNEKQMEASGWFQKSFEVADPKAPLVLGIYATGSNVLTASLELEGVLLIPSGSKKKLGILIKYQ